MRKIILILALLIPTELTPQSFHSLDGIEDQQGNTHLVYRLGVQGFYFSPVYRFDVNTGVETFIMDAHYSSFPGGDDAKAVLDFEFFPNDDQNFMNAGFTIYPDNHSYIARNDSIVFGGISGFDRVDISKQNPLKVFVFGGGGPVRSWDGGYTFPVDSIPAVTNFRAISLADFDDNVLFGLNEDNQLAKNGAVADTSKVFFDEYTKFLYDVNQFHVYRVNRTYGGYAFYVSNNKGDAFTWTKTFQSENPLYISIDPAQSGLIFLADGKKIYKSTNNGYSFTHYKNLISRIIGIYKKPSDEIIYAATPYVIYNITPDDVTIVKALSVAPDVFEWFPLAIGNTWVYSSYWIEENWGYPPTYHFAGTKYLRVVSDTLIESKKYFVLENEMLNQFVFDQRMFLRVDSVSARIYRYWETLNGEFLFHDMNAEVGDTVYYPPLNQFVYYYLWDESEVLFWNDLKMLRTYFENAPCGCGHTLVKGLGPGSAWFNEFGGSEDLLKGAVINGVVFGDTTYVVSVDDDPDQIPTQFKLEQNYPNPFNPSTKISWQSPVGSHQTLKVYDVLGREVAILVDEYRDAGSYEVEFSSASGSAYGGDGSRLASGVYYYQLKIGEFVQTKKMLLIK